MLDLTGILGKKPVRKETVFLRNPGCRGRLLKFFILLFFILFQLPLTTARNSAFAEDMDIFSQKGNFELGGALGTPSGLNSRYWITDMVGLDSSAGISLDRNPVITVDLLFEPFSLYRSSTWETKLFVGFGSLFAKEDQDFKNNLRVPVGLSFPLFRFPLNFSVFVAPAYEMTPKNEFELNYGIGVRYNFTRAAANRKKQEHLEREVRELERDVESLKYGLDKTKGKLRETEGELSVTRNKLGELTDKLDDIKDKLDKTTGELYKTRTELLTTTNELDNTKNQLDDVQNELKNTKKVLDDKQTELARKQAELDKAKDIINNAFTGKEKDEEIKKLAEKQKALDRQLAELSREKQDWEKIRAKENQRREQLRNKCEERGGIIDENGYCVCPKNKEWDEKTDRCVCAKGFYSSAGDCKPCEIITYYGECADKGCRDDESQVSLSKGPHKYVCVKKCRKAHEAWSKRKNTCVCADGFYRDNSGACVPRQ